jgi:hypothetical protein
VVFSGIRVLWPKEPVRVTPMNLVGQSRRGVPGRLRAEIDGFNSLIWHQGELGRENELPLTRVRGGSWRVWFQTVRRWLGGCR